MSLIAGMITEVSEPIAGKPAPTGIVVFTDLVYTINTCGSGLARDSDLRPNAKNQFLCNLLINSASAWVNPQD